MADNSTNLLGGVEDNLSNIETSENLLIQHIRTAGIRKPREIELIDEIMTLRRERRRSFSSIEQAARVFRKENMSLQMQLEKTMRESASEISLFKSSLSSNLKKKDLEIQSVIDHYDDLFLKEKERNRFVTKANEEKLAKIYEEKMRQVERKIEELVGAKAKHDHTTAEAIAFDLTAKSISELNEQHQMKLMKYKDALRSVAIREKEMADEVLKMTEKLQNTEHEKRAAITRLHQAEGLLAVLHDKEIEAKRTLSSMQVLVGDSNAQMARMQSELGSLKKRFEERLSAVAEEHNAELARIDSKVRKALSLRDDSILQLRTKLQQAENKKIELERILSDLNSGLSAPLASRSRY